MGKQQSPARRARASLGKGKVTPVQIAFLVDRYLADNGFAATLASFQSEAAELFPKTRTREAPKGLLTLAGILDEYVSLKEQRIAVEQEKRQVEALLGGIHDAVQGYSSSGGVLPQPSPSLPAPPAPPPTPAVVPAPAGRIAPSANPGDRSRPGPIVQKIQVLRSSPAVVPNNAPQPSAFSPPLPDTSGSNKRKNSKPVLKAPAAPNKKRRGRSQTDVSAIGVEGTGGPSQSDDTNGIEQPAQKFPARNLPSTIHQDPDPFVGGSCVAKSASSQLPDSNTSSTSPKTPQQACSSQGQKMASFLASSSISQSASASTPKELTPSKCSIISSKTVVVSPYKKECYYAVQKSCCISSSPLKPSPRRGGRRDCVKSRLDFDESDLPASSEKPALAESPASSADHEVEDIFDFDIPDFDMDFSFADFLVDMDLECGEIIKSRQPAIEPSSADYITGSEGESGSVCLEMGHDVSGPYLSSMSEVNSKEGMNVTEGHESVASVKTITKCIKIVSPVKGRRNSCLESLELQYTA